MEENSEEQKPLCIVEVNENIRRVETGEPLTRSLITLNANCDFRKKYNEMDKIIHPSINCRFCKKEIDKKGYCSDTCRLKQRVYQQSYNKRKNSYQQKPEIKERKRLYNRMPKVRERQKLYNQKPEVKERRRIYERRPEVRMKRRAYEQRPEIKERRRLHNQKPETKEKARQRYIKHKLQNIKNERRF
jgi:hypothetical protein